MHLSYSVAAGALAATASAQSLHYGFNTGAIKTDGTPKVKSDFLQEFRTAQNLETAGSPTWNSVRLYTNMQAGTENDPQPISAFEAAIETNTKLLLGIWTSGTKSIEGDIKALKRALDRYGSKLTNLVLGISIGSEDLYRDSEQGIINKAGVGNGPDAIVQFINDFKTAFKGTLLESIRIGHVETWDAWTNGTNRPVIDAVQFIGVDEYPYYEGGKNNTIENAASRFDQAFNAVKAVVGDKEIWITETGWPSEGITWDLAVSSVENAETYWHEIGCKRLFGKYTTFWYNLRDSNSVNKQSFAITDNLSTTPKWNLTCRPEDTTGPSPSPSPLSTATSPHATGHASVNGSGTDTAAGPDSGSDSSGSDSSGSNASGSNSSGSGTTTSGSGSGSGSNTSGNLPTVVGARTSATPTSPTSGAHRVVSDVVYGSLALVAAVFFLL